MKRVLEAKISARHLSCLLLLLMMQAHTLAQEAERDSAKPKIRGAVMMANSHVPNAFIGDKKVAVIPTWGFDVDYFLHSRMSVALQGDISLQKL